MINAVHDFLLEWLGSEGAGRWGEGRGRNRLGNQRDRMRRFCELNHGDEVSGLVGKSYPLW